MPAPAAKAKAHAKAKAKARARRVASHNQRRDRRRAAVRELNAFATGVGHRPICAKTATAADVERLVRVLQRRMPTDDQVAQLRAVAEDWQRHGGRFSVPLEDAPDATALAAPISQHRVLLRGFRLESKAFMLTFNSPAFVLNDWEAFREHIKQQYADCGAAAWAACQERSEEPGRLHFHAYLFWSDGVGIRLRQTTRFEFKGVTPRVDLCRAAARNALNREGALHGLWYVSVYKKGTIVTETNLEAWRGYTPQVPWLQGLWKDHKLTHDQYIALSSRFRIGHAQRKRDADEVRATEKAAAVADAKKAALELLKPKRLRFKPLPAPIRAWLSTYSTPDWRYSMLVLVGPSKLGKTELAKSVKGPENTLVVDCQHALHPDLSAFDRAKHQAVVLDDISGPQLVLGNKKLLQAHVDGATLGQSPTQHFVYEVFLWRIPIVLTTNNWSVADLRGADREWLDKNCVVVAIEDRVWAS